VKGSRPGRPRLTGSAQGVHVQHPLTAEEREAIEAAAERAGVKASKWARRVLLHAALRDA
jgi:hypothetical protein